MAYFQRLIICAFVAFLAWLPASSFAVANFNHVGVIPVSPVELWGNSAPYGTAPGAYYISYINSAHGWTGTFSGVTHNATNDTLSGVANGAAYSFQAAIQWQCSGVTAASNTQTAPTCPAACPNNAVGSGSPLVCTCSLGFAANVGASACNSTSAATAAGLAALNAAGAPLVTAAGSTPSLKACYNGVTVVGTGAAGGIKSGVSTGFEIYGPFTSDGSACDSTVTSSAAGESAASSANPGNCVGSWGSVDLGSGPHDVCVPTPPLMASPTVSGTSSSTVTGTGATANGVTTAGSTSCTGAVCTTTTTSTTVTNGVSGTPVTSTKSVDQPSFCSSNPNDPACSQNKSSFGSGGCGSPPSCSGDAIQCAIAAQTFATQCALTTAPTEIDVATAAFNDGIKKTGDQTDSITDKVNITSDNFSTSAFFGSQAGAADVSVAMPYGGSLTIPMGTLNTWLRNLGFVLRAVSFLIAVRIVGRG